MKQKLFVVEVQRLFQKIHQQHHYNPWM